MSWTRRIKLIDLSINGENLKQNVQLAKANGVILPTFKQMKSPDANAPKKIKDGLIGLNKHDTSPYNLFRVTWKNAPPDSGIPYGKPNYIELPKKLTGVDARIICMVGKFFPTGSHKVGATFGCLVPRLVTGQFNIRKHKAVWPSTGNYCRGGAFNSKLLGCDSIAILPEGMSRERFDWLDKIAGEIIKTPGSESNVKEIYDETNRIAANRTDCMIFNQFEDYGNYLWHYSVTGNAVSEVFENIKGNDGRFAGICLSVGSSGTMACGDYLKQRYPHSKIAVGEALQCPTILNNGYGEHRIEGIGDRHIPWILNVRNIDIAMGIDDSDPMSLLRLFNEPAGKAYLANEIGLSEDEVASLAFMGISGISNILCAIKFAKYYELTSKDVVATILTDSVEMYNSRLDEMRDEQGEYDSVKAAVDYAVSLLKIRTDNLIELTYTERKRIHNLKYFTWIEQQGKEETELHNQWYRQDKTFEAVQRQVDEIDSLITAFNEETGLLKDMR